MQEPDTRSIGELVGESVEHVREIFRSEFELAAIEMRKEAKKAGLGAAQAGAALLFTVFGLNFLLWAGVWALAPEMPNWAASLIIGFVTLVIAGVLAMTAKATFGAVNAVPEAATRQMKETVQWAKRQP